MDIKEIAEQVSKRIYVEDGLLLSKFISEKLANAAIESYKAELLKEVGEPVGYLHQWIEYHPYGDTFAGEPCSAITNDGKPFDKSDTVTPLYTLDQLAAAVLKATKPLEKEIERLKTVPMKYRRMAFNAQLQDENNELRTQLAAAQEEIARLNALYDEIDSHCSWAGFCDVATLKDRLIKTYEGFDAQRDADKKKIRELQDQLAKAEQRVAEACALQVATEIKFHWLDAARVAKEIRSGEWKRYLK